MASTPPNTGRPTSTYSTPVMMLATIEGNITYAVECTSPRNVIAFDVAKRARSSWIIPARALYSRISGPLCWFSTRFKKYVYTAFTTMIFLSTACMMASPLGTAMADKPNGTSKSTASSNTYTGEFTNWANPKRAGTCIRSSIAKAPNAKPKAMSSEKKFTSPSSINAVRPPFIAVPR